MPTIRTPRQILIVFALLVTGCDGNSSNNGSANQLVDLNNDYMRMWEKSEARGTAISQ